MKGQHYVFRNEDFGVLLGYKEKKVPLSVIARLMDVPVSSIKTASEFDSYSAYYQNRQYKKRLRAEKMRKHYNIPPTENTTVEEPEVKSLGAQIIEETKAQTELLKKILTALDSIYLKDSFKQEGPKVRLW